MTSTPAFAPTVLGSSGSLSALRFCPCAGFDVCAADDAGGPCDVGGVVGSGIADLDPSSVGSSPRRFEPLDVCPAVCAVTLSLLARSRDCIGTPGTAGLGSGSDPLGHVTGVGAGSGPAIGGPG